MRSFLNRMSSLSMLCGLERDGGEKKKGRKEKPERVSACIATAVRRTSITVFMLNLELSPIALVGPTIACVVDCKPTHVCLLSSVLFLIGCREGHECRCIDHLDLSGAFG